MAWPAASRKRPPPAGFPCSMPPVRWSPRCTTRASGTSPRAANSSKSNRLRESGTEGGVPSYLVADGSELRAEWLRDAKAVGITAGASAPEVLVDDVIEALRRIGPVTVSVLPGREENIEFRLPAELTAG